MSTINRELIRLANRERLNSTEVASVIEFSAQMLAFQTATTEDTDSDRMVATALFDTWKASYDDEPPSQG